MAIVHVANFHGMKYEYKIKGGNVVSRYKNNYFEISFTRSSVSYVDGFSFYIGRDIKNTNKSVLKINAIGVGVSVVSPLDRPIHSSIYLNNFMAQFDKAATGDVFTFGFRYIRECEDTAVTNSLNYEISARFGSGYAKVLGNAGILFNNVMYNIEYRFTKTSKTHCNVDYYLNKTRMGGSVEVLISELLTLEIRKTPTTNQVDYIISDMYFGIDKVTDTVKTGLAGPLDVRHYTPSVTTDTENWVVVDGTAQSKVDPDVTILEALASNDVGIDPAFASNMTLAMTDSSGDLGTFKFENVPNGNYLGYAIDTFVNQPQSQSGDMHAEVYEGDSEEPIAAVTSIGITRAPGTFNQVFITNQNKPVNQDDLHAIQVKIGSKKIIPE